MHTTTTIRTTSLTVSATGHYINKNKAVLHVQFEFPLRDIGERVDAELLMLDEGADSSFKLANLVFSNPHADTTIAAIAALCKALYDDTQEMQILLSRVYAYYAQSNLR